MKEINRIKYRETRMEVTLSKKKNESNSSTTHEWKPWRSKLCKQLPTSGIFTHI